MRDGLARRTALALAGVLLAVAAVVGIAGTSRAATPPAVSHSGAIAPVPTAAADVAAVPVAARAAVDHVASDRTLRSATPLLVAALAALVGAATRPRLGRVDRDRRRRAGPLLRPRVAPRAPPSSLLAG